MHHFVLCVRWSVWSTSKFSSRDHVLHMPKYADCQFHSTFKLPPSLTTIAPPRNCSAAPAHCTSCCSESSQLLVGRLLPCVRTCESLASSSHADRRKVANR